MVVGAHQSFKFFRQNTWFLENHRALSKLYRESVHENQFYIDHTNHLKKKHSQLKKDMLFSKIFSQ